MYISQTEKEKLYKGLGLFQEAFRSYIITLLIQKVGDDWAKEFTQSLSPQQQENWERNARKEIKPENLVDFQYFKNFAIKNKDLVRGDFGVKTNDLPTWLGEIADVRHKVAHFNEVEEDESKKAWIHLRAIARIISKPELEQVFLNLEKDKSAPEKNTMHQAKIVPDQFIESTVLSSSKLSLKINQGENYRIMKTGWNGSLWIYKTERRGYRMETTGEVGTRLNSEIRNFLGRDYDHETVKGYKIWFVDTADEVRRIIEIYDRI